MFCYQQANLNCNELPANSYSSYSWSYNVKFHSTIRIFISAISRSNKFIYNPVYSYKLYVMLKYYLVWNHFGDHFSVVHCYSIDSGNRSKLESVSRKTYDKYLRFKYTDRGARIVKVLLICAIELIDKYYVQIWIFCSERNNKYKLANKRLLKVENTI